MMGSSETPPLSRMIQVNELATGVTTTIRPTEPELQHLAAACGLVAIKNLEARLSVTPEKTAVRVRGVVSAVATQTCVLSLEAFDAAIEEAVDLVFLPEAERAAWIADHRPDPHADLAFDDDPPDAIVGGKIDLGAVTAEFLALGLDPYPRKPGVAFSPDPDADAKDPSPFAALARWKQDD